MYKRQVISLADYGIFDQVVILPDLSPHTEHIFLLSDCIRRSGQISLMLPGFLFVKFLNSYEYKGFWLFCKAASVRLDVYKRQILCRSVARLLHHTTKCPYNLSVCVMESIKLFDKNCGFPEPAPAARCRRYNLPSASPRKDARSAASVSYTHLETAHAHLYFKTILFQVIR